MFNKLIVGTHLNLPKPEMAFEGFREAVTKTLGDREIEFVYDRNYGKLVDDVNDKSDRDTDIILMHSSFITGDHGSKAHKSHLNSINEHSKKLNSNAANLAHVEYSTAGGYHFKKPKDLGSLLEEPGAENLPLQIDFTGKDQGHNGFIEFLSWFDEAVSRNTQTDLKKNDSLVEV